MKPIKLEIADPTTEEGALDILKLNPSMSIGLAEIQATAAAEALGLGPDEIDYFMECDEDYYD